MPSTSFALVAPPLPFLLCLSDACTHGSLSRLFFSAIPVSPLHPSPSLHQKLPEFCFPPTCPSSAPHSLLQGASQDCPQHRSSPRQQGEPCPAPPLSCPVSFTAVCEPDLGNGVFCLLPSMGLRRQDCSLKHLLTLTPSIHRHIRNTCCGPGSQALCWVMGLVL